mmetsp:Transcript_143310/g.457978  ORF Transcript_143310/g.457978 Transcript_143310/m.457978 type:complete len:466 (-) Transcript_143310:325-1722(-)
MQACNTMLLLAIGLRSVQGSELPLGAQLRGGTAHTAEGALGEVATADGVGTRRRLTPSWCGWIPKAVQGGSCAENANGSASSGDYAQAATGSSEVSGDVPAWCRWVPDAFKKDACRGSSLGCTCSSWCADTPSASQKWVPECCGCGTGSGTNSSVNHTRSDGSSNSGRSSGEGVPAWCRYVPTSLQNDACLIGGKGCRCRDWCDATPSRSQRWNPECCGCAAAAPGNESHSQDGEDAGPAGTVDGQRLPAWCRWVPDAFKKDACRGSSEGCTCSDWCDRPAPRSGIRSAVAAIRRRTSAVETAPTAQFRSGASSCLSPSRRIHAEGAARAARARTGAAARHGFPRPGTLSAAAAARQCGTVQMMTRPMLPTAPMQPMSLHGVSGCQKRSRRMLVVAAPRAAHARAGVPTRLPFPKSGIPSAAAVVQEEAPEGMQTSNLAISQLPAAWCFAASPLGFTCSQLSTCP